MVIDPLPPHQRTWNVLEARHSPKNPAGQEAREGAAPSGVRGPEPSLWMASCKSRHRRYSPQSYSSRHHTGAATCWVTTRIWPRWKQVH
jgi:hypothetical protein